MVGRTNWGCWKTFGSKEILPLWSRKAKFDHWKSPFCWIAVLVILQNVVNSQGREITGKTLLNGWKHVCFYLRVKDYDTVETPFEPLKEFIKVLLVKAWFRKVKQLKHVYVREQLWFRKTVYGRTQMRLSCVWRTSQPASRAVSADANSTQLNSINRKHIWLHAYAYHLTCP